jgi:hypothetical protein
MFRYSIKRPRIWQLIAAMAVLSTQVLLLAHAHEQDTSQAQLASCLTCVAAQNASPACPNSLPEIEREIGHSPFIAESASALASATQPTARQRSPPLLS